MRFQAKLTTSPQQLERALSFTVKQMIEKNLPKVEQFLTNEIRDIITRGFRSSPEYQALISGNLRKDFGIDNGGPAVEAIIDRWANSFISVFSPITLVGTKLRFKGTVQCIESSFADVINMAEGHVFSKGGTVPWLRWLLLEGDRILIQDYLVQYNLSSKSKSFSRTGEALMRHKQGASFKVDPTYAGTIKENWTTRVVNNIGAEIEAALENAADKMI